ncbi:hypothetical protein V6N13_074294 [Hibiscus sabdariffa]
MTNNQFPWIQTNEAASNCRKTRLGEDGTINATSPILGMYVEISSCQAYEGLLSPMVGSNSLVRGSIGAGSSKPGSGGAGSKGETEAPAERTVRITSALPVKRAAGDAFRLAHSFELHR